MTFWARLIIYAGIVLLYVGTAAWIVRAWTRKRYRDKSPSDLHYIAVGQIIGGVHRNKKRPLMSESGRYC
jgi:uncharacterized membrane protein YidH (DUF202 family)